MTTQHVINLCVLKVVKRVLSSPKIINEFQSTEIYTTESGRIVTPSEDGLCRSSPTIYSTSELENLEECSQLSTVKTLESRGLLRVKNDWTALRLHS